MLGGATTTAESPGGGTGLQSNVPVAVTGLTDATDLAVGYMHTCAIVGGGGAACWGQGGYGQLGDGVRPSFALVPVAVGGMTGATALIAGDRPARSWAMVTCRVGGPTGSGIGQRHKRRIDAPIAVPGDHRSTDLAAGTGHTCVIVDDEAASCWGYNASGQLGNGTTMSSNVPVPVPGLS